MKNIISILILFVIAQSAYSQEECYQTLVSAEQAYFGGQLKNVEGILLPCLRDGFNKEQRVSAYRVLALSYLFSMRYAQTDSAILLLLNSNPHYEPRADDPPEFVKRLDGFKVHPTWGINFNFGYLQPMFKDIEVSNLRNIPSDVTYTGVNGLTLGLNVSYYLRKNWLIEGGFELQRFTFKVENINSQAETRLEEKQGRTQLNLMGGYNYNGKGYTAQLLVGIGFNSLYSATSNLSLLEKVQGGQGETIYRESGEFSNLDRRSKHDYRPIILFRIGLPQKNNFVINAYARYEFGTQNISQNPYSDPIQMVKYEWVDDSFKGNYFSIGLSIAKLLYKVKKYEK